MEIAVADEHTQLLRQVFKDGKTKSYRRKR